MQTIALWLPSSNDSIAGSKIKYDWVHTELYSDRTLSNKRWERKSSKRNAIRKFARLSWTSNRLQFHRFWFQTGVSSFLINDFFHKKTELTWFRNISKSSRNTSKLNLIIAADYDADYDADNLPRLLYLISDRSRKLIVNGQCSQFKLDISENRTFRREM